MINTAGTQTFCDLCNRPTHRGECVALLEAAAPSPALTLDSDELRKAVEALHHWDVTKGWTAFNDIVAQLDRALLSAGDKAIPDDPAEAMAQGISGERWANRRSAGDKAEAGHVRSWTMSEQRTEPCGDSNHAHFQEWLDRDRAAPSPALTRYTPNLTIEGGESGFPVITEVANEQTSGHGPAQSGGTGPTADETPPAASPTVVAPSPALTREALAAALRDRYSWMDWPEGVYERDAQLILEYLDIGTPPPAGMDALRQRVIDTARDLNMTMPDLGDGDPMSALDDALADLDEALSKTPPPSSTREEPAP